MSIPIVDRRGTPILGRNDEEVNRADQLVEWSLKHESGKRWVKDLPFGLRLGFVSNGSEPKMYIHWNQHKFNAFLKQVGTQERFLVHSYGICISHRSERTIVRLLGAGKTSQTLWDSALNSFSREQNDSDVNWLLGIIKFLETGPEFFTQAESQLELEQASAVAIIVDKPAGQPVAKAKSVGTVIPERPNLAPESRTRLLQDILLNRLLASNAG